MEQRAAGPPAPGSAGAYAELPLDPAGGTAILHFPSICLSLYPALREHSDLMLVLPLFPTRLSFQRPRALA